MKIGLLEAAGGSDQALAWLRSSHGDRLEPRNAIDAVYPTGDRCSTGRPRPPSIGA